MPNLGLINPLWLRALVCGALLLLAGALGTYGLATPITGLIVLPLLVMIIGGFLATFGVRAALRYRRQTPHRPPPLRATSIDSGSPIPHRNLDGDRWPWRRHGIRGGGGSALRRAARQDMAIASSALEGKCENP